MKHASGFLELVNEAMPRVREITAEEVQSLSDAQIIDVREDREWNAGYIPGAKHLSRGIIERDIEIAIPDKTTLLILYCGGGYRSALAADSIQKMGYSNVRSMAGGWKAWCAQNPKA